MKIKKSLFIIGVALLILNILGNFLPLRNPDIYEEEHTGFEQDITLTEKEVYNLIEKRENESNETYVIRVNKAVNRGIAHYWLDNGIDKYHLRVPIWENYILYLASFIIPDVYRKYTYQDYNKAIERGVGLCDQHAIIVTGILNDNGIDAELIGLSGHFVLRAKVSNNTWYVLDPDYGVVIPHDIYEIEKNPEVIREYYQNYQNVHQLMEVYEREGNYICQGAIEYCYTMKYYVEYLSYIAIWIIPLMMFTPYSLTLLKGRVKRK